MVADAMTLYKFMVLYMLSRVSFPLTNSQISNFMLDKEYTNYFTLQEVLSDLSANNFIQEVTYRNATQYILTDEGKETISYFPNVISDGIKHDIDEFLKENQYELKSEVGTTAHYYRSDRNDYIVSFQVKEGDSSLIDLKVTVPTEEIADTMCSKWKDNSQGIYEYIMHHLM
ncbi:MAG: DUF4364 family protein [Lachnospiraceae bacterium]